MAVTPRAAIALAAVTGAAVLATAGSASAACRISLEFQNPYRFPVTVDLRESNISPRLLARQGVSRGVWGPRRKLGNVRYRIGAGSVRTTRPFRSLYSCAPGTLKSYRRIHLELSYRGRDYDATFTTNRIRRPIKVDLADLRGSGMPNRPRMNRPVIQIPSTGTTPIRSRLVRWTVPARIPGGSFRYDLWLIDEEAGRYIPIRVGQTTKARRLLVRQPAGPYRITVRQEDVTGELGPSAEEFFEITDPAGTPES